MWNYLWFIVLIKVTTSDKRNTPDMPNLAGERPDRVHRSRELCALYGEGNWQLIPSYVTAYVVKYLAQFLWTCRQNRCLDWFPRLRAISLKVSSKRGYWVNTIDSCSSLANFIFRFSNIKKKIARKGGGCRRRAERVENPSRPGCSIAAFSIDQRSQQFD